MLKTPCNSADNQSMPSSVVWIAPHSFTNHTFIPVNLMMYAPFILTTFFSLSFIASLPCAFAGEPHIYRFERRVPAISDACAYLSIDLNAITGSGADNSSIPIQGCVCQGALSRFFQSGLLAETAENHGHELVESNLNKIVSLSCLDSQAIY